MYNRIEGFVATESCLYDCEKEILVLQRSTLSASYIKVVKQVAELGTIRSCPKTKNIDATLSSAHLTEHEKLHCTPQALCKGGASKNDHSTAPGNVYG